MKGLYNSATHQTWLASIPADGDTTAHRQLERAMGNSLSVSFIYFEHDVICLYPVKHINTTSFSGQGISVCVRARACALGDSLLSSTHTGTQSFHHCVVRPPAISVWLHYVKHAGTRTTTARILTPSNTFWFDTSVPPLQTTDQPPITAALLAVKYCREEEKRWWRRHRAQFNSDGMFAANAECFPASDNPFLTQTQMFYTHTLTYVCTH